MNTMSRTFTESNKSANNGSLSVRYDKFIEDLKFSHFGLISMTILIGSIMGGIGAMFVFENQAPQWEFIVGLAFTMGNLVAAISQAPTKWVVSLFTLSIKVNTILVLANMF